MKNSETAPRLRHFSTHSHTLTQTQYKIYFKKKYKIIIKKLKNIFNVSIFIKFLQIKCKLFLSLNKFVNLTSVLNFKIK